jgi:hypothetical protein
MRNKSLPVVEVFNNLTHLMIQNAVKVTSLQHVTQRNVVRKGHLNKGNLNGAAKHPVSCCLNTLVEISFRVGVLSSFLGHTYITLVLHVQSPI